MPELIYNVKFQIDEASLEQVSQASSRATGGATGGGQTFYEQNINNSKRYQAVIKQELNLIVNQTQARQRSANSLDQVDKATRDFIKTIQDETAAVRAATAQTRLQENVSNQSLISLGERSKALKDLISDERILAIAQNKSHPLYRTANQLISAGAGAAKSAAMEMGKYGTQILEIARSSTGLVSVESALTQAVKAKTDEVRRYNAIVEVRGALSTEQEIEDYQRATQELQELRAELLQVANAAEDIDSSQVREMNQALKGAGQAATSADRYLSGMAGQMSGVNRLGNNVNQVMLSFGDAIQDGAQFSYGFASGMRAVGNNLTFAAEQFSYAYQRAGSLSSVLSEFKSVLMGPVGIVVAINAVVTVITMYTRYLETTRKSTEELSKSSDILTRIFGEQEKAILEVAKALNIRSEMGAGELIEGYSQVNASLAATNELIDRAQEKEDARIALGEEINRLGRLSIGLRGEEFDQVQAQLIELREQQKQETRLSEENRRKLEIYKEYRKEQALQLKDLNEEERIRRDVLEVEADIQELRISGFIKEFSEREKNTTQAERLVELEERVNQKIRERGQEAREQRLAEETYRREAFERFLNPPDPEEDPNDAAEERTMQRVKKEMEAIQQLEIFRALSNIRSIEDFYNAYDTELNILKDQLNAQLITQAEFNLQKEILDRDYLDSKIRMEQEASSMILGINSNLASSITGLLSSAFQNHKAIAIAETIVSTYFAAQQAYAATLAGAALNPLTAPFAPALAKKASISAIIQGAAKVAAIAATEVGSKSVATSGGGGGSSAGAFGFQMNKIEGAQTFRTPAFTPTNGDRRSTPKVDVQIMADRKQLYAIVKQGEEEYRQIKV